MFSDAQIVIESSFDPMGLRKTGVNCYDDVERRETVLRMRWTVIDSAFGSMGGRKKCLNRNDDVERENNQRKGWYN